MPPTRCWLDWSRPCLTQAADWMIDASMTDADATTDGIIACAQSGTDMRGTVCVLPGRRAGRLFLASLLRSARTRSPNRAGAGAITPPRIITPSRLMEVLAAATPQATDKGRVQLVTELELEFTWISALRSADQSVLEPVIGEAPDRDDHQAWSSLARQLAGVISDLHAAMRTCEDVIEHVESLGRVREADRWRAIAQLAMHVRRALTAQRLIDRGELTARLIGVDNASIATEMRAIVLVGVAELAPAQRALLERIDDRVTALIHAPEDVASRFDALGAADTRAWSDAPLDIEECENGMLESGKPANGGRRIVICQRSPQEADAIIETIAGYDGRYAVDQIAIGLGDDQLAPFVSQRARWASLDVHDAAGRSLTGSGPCELLRRSADWIETQRFAALAHLLELPAVELAVMREIESRSGAGAASKSAHGIRDWISLLDRYFSDHLHDRFTGTWLGDQKIRTQMKLVHDAVKRIISDPLRSALHEPDTNMPNGADALATADRPLCVWMLPLLTLLANVYGGFAIAEDDRPALNDDDHPTIAPRDQAACEHAVRIAAMVAEVEEPLQPHISAAAASQWMADRLADESAPDAMRDDQIEMLGWLELALDPAPALIIAGFNDRFVPASVLHDAFLPDSVRAQLGLSCNTSRAARDSYLLTTMLRSREHLTLICSRRATNDEPLMISRLLARESDDQRTLARLRRFFVHDHSENASDGSSPAARNRDWPIGLIRPAVDAPSRFVVPALTDQMLQELVPVMSMRVTDFRKYIACPYRFALERVLELNEFELDAPGEMNALQFGSLAHDVLEVLGRDDNTRDCTNADTIAALLDDALDTMIRREYGNEPTPAVRVQQAQLRKRLFALAARQAQWRRDGWRIAHAEWVLPESAHLDLKDSEAPMRLSGRIDRIDINENTSAVRIVDYKTGDSVTTPDKSHRRGSGDDRAWVDLQLPLYRHLLMQAGMAMCDPDAIELGYVTLSKKVTQIKFQPAGWDGDALNDAMECARTVAMAVRTGMFWPPTSAPEKYAPFKRLFPQRVDDENGSDDGEATSFERGDVA